MTSHQSRKPNRGAGRRLSFGSARAAGRSARAISVVATLSAGLVLGPVTSGCGGEEEPSIPGATGGTNGTGGGGSAGASGNGSHESDAGHGDDTAHPSDATLDNAGDGRSTSDAPVTGDGATGRIDASDSGKTGDATGTADTALPDRTTIPDAATVDVPSVDTGSTSDSGWGNVDSGSCGCAAYGSPAVVGTEPSSLTELSGIVASRRNPGVLYAHNDSGSNATLVVIGETGTSLGQIVLSGVSAVDWEDVAVGPCDTGTCVFVGDIGDNNLAYASRAVYRFTEPTISPTTSMGTVMVTPDALTYVYPDARHNAETLLVDPLSGDIFIVTKVSNVPSTVYRMPKPFTPGTQATVEKVGDLSLPGTAGLVTGGDVHPCGNRMLIRTYPMIYEFKLPAGQPFTSIFATPGTAVATPTQDQESKGEGVTYAADGSGYFTASELDGKSSRSIFRVRCQ